MVPLLTTLTEVQQGCVLCSGVQAEVTATAAPGSGKEGLSAEKLPIQRKAGPHLC